jgi:4-amino-4-deoxy-L-arabinose transferase-like glycosyltransferase
MSLEIFARKVNKPAMQKPVENPGAGAAPEAGQGRRGRRVLLLILLAGAIVRLGLWAWFRDVPIQIWDEKDYNALATMLAEHGEFAFHPGAPTSIRPPLYPAVVAGIYRVAGVENIQAVRLFQAALSLLNVVVLCRLGAEAASPRTGLWLAALYAFYPTLLGFNNLLLTEVLFTFWLTTACYGVVRYYRGGRIGWLALAGLLLGLGALTRSVLWLSPPLLACYVLLTGEGTFRRRLLAGGVLLAAFAATIAPWSLRNTRLQRTFVTIDTMSGRNLMMGNYAHTPLYRSWDAIALEGEKSWLHQLNQAHPLPGGLTQGQLDKLAFKEGLRFMAENPGLTAQRDLVKFFDFWGLERELVAGAAAGYFGDVPRWVTPVLAVVIFGSYAAAMFLAVFGAILAPLRDRRLHWFFLLVIVFICGAHVVVFGHSRYHLPLIPLVLLYAAQAVVSRSEIRQRRRSAPFALAACCCLILVVGWGWGLVAGDWERFQNLFGLVN